MGCAKIKGVQLQIFIFLSICYFCYFQFYVLEHFIKPKWCFRCKLYSKIQKRWMFWQKFSYDIALFFFNHKKSKTNQAQSYNYYFIIKRFCVLENMKSNTNTNYILALCVSIDNQSLFPASFPIIFVESRTQLFCLSYESGYSLYLIEQKTLRGWKLAHTFSTRNIIRKE